MKFRSTAPALIAGVSLFVLAACGDSFDPTSRLSPEGLSMATGSKATVTIIAPDSTLAVGATMQLQTISQSGTDVLRNNPTVTWRSTDTAVARVTTRGLVTGVAAGASLIVATHVWRGSANLDTLVLRVGDGTTTVAAAPAAAPVTPTAAPVAPATPAAPTAAAPITPATPSTPLAPSAVTLPAALISSGMPAMNGRSLVVRASGNLQAAIDSARPGDAILLDAGATYRGAFVLRRKTQGATPAWIVIRPATMSGLPAEGTRAMPTDAPAMPKIIASSASAGAINTDPSAGYYRLVGVEIAVDPAVKDMNALVRIHHNTGARTIPDLPHHIVLDRVYIHGNDGLQLTRCVLGNGAHIAVIDSYLSECHAKGRDSQAFEAYSGPGPIKLVNNTLEGAGENIMFGGAPADMPDFVPSDIEIRRNHVVKPLQWMATDAWTVKNLLEIKVGQRVLIEGNVFENNWIDAQTGRAILFRSADQTTRTPWSRTRDITFRHNIVRRSPSGFSIDAQGLAGAPNDAMSRVVVENNLMYDIGDKALGSSGGILFQITGSVAGNPLRDVTIDRNTAVFSTGNATRNSALALDGPAHQSIRITDNILELGLYGFKGSSTASGSVTMDKYLPNAVMQGNVLLGTATAALYATAGRVMAAGATSFSNLAAGDLRTTGSLGSTNAGANVTLVMLMTNGVVR